jgi:hypothetical protein
MTTTTTGVKPPNRGPSTRQILLLSIIVQIILVSVIWLAEPLRKTQKSFDPNAAEELTDAAKERNKERREREEARREKTELRKADAEILKRREQEMRKRNLKEKLEEVRLIKREMEAIKNDSFQELIDRPKEILQAKRADELLALCDKILEAAMFLRHRGMDEPLAQSSTLTCEALKDSTIEFKAEGNPTDQIPVLIKQATEIARPLKQRSNMMMSAYPDDADRRTRFGLFVHDSNYLRETLRNYVNYLEALNGFNNAIEQDKQELAAEIAPQDDSDTSVPISEMSLDQVLEAISASEANIEASFNNIRTAKIAAIEQITFNDAQARVGDPTQAFESKDNTIKTTSEYLKTIADLKAYRESLAQKSQLAIEQWSRAKNMAQQAGIQTKKNGMGRSAAPFQKGGQGKNGQGQGQAGKGNPSNGKSQIASEKASRYGRGTPGGALTSAGNKDANGRPERLLTKISLDAIKARALPGRRFSPDSSRSGWLYLDSWYIIGPWENNGQLNYNNTHPPELSVNLDAIYTNGKIRKKTKKPRKLQWQFLQSDIMRLVPPEEEGNSTYYAFTEVYFEEATEMLLAIASDDAARMWVNDRLIWEDHGQSGWNLNEGFQRVAFRQGFNKFLVRIENGPVLCEFSVLLCPPDQVEN